MWDLRRPQAVVGTVATLTGASYLGASMIFRLSTCLRWVGTPRFKPELLDELFDCLPRLGGLLQEFCERGTPREKGLREIRDLFLDGPKESQQPGCFDVRFEESVHLGDRELGYTEPVIGTVRFLLDLETGD